LDLACVKVLSAEPQKRPCIQHTIQIVYAQINFVYIDYTFASIIFYFYGMDIEGWW
jgi:hypothetical protein